jgi:hypothetical protein
MRHEHQIDIVSVVRKTKSDCAILSVDITIWLQTTRDDTMNSTAGSLS